jgi:hypothetical protein
MQALWEALHGGKVNLSLDTIQNRALFRLWRFSGQTGLPSISFAERLLT